MKRLASLLLASALALTAAGCAGQNPAASTQSGPPEAVESGKADLSIFVQVRRRDGGEEALPDELPAGVGLFALARANVVFG